MKKGFLFIFIAHFWLTACSIIYEQDPRNPSDEWYDNQFGIQLAGIVNKAPYSGEARVNAASYDGNVLLIGQVRTLALKNQLLEQVRQISGVKQVYEQIRLRAPLPLAQVSSDTWLTTKIKSALIASKKLRHVDIKVMTENSEVFLLGYVTKDQADEATEIVRNISGVRQVIQVFQYVN